MKVKFLTGEMARIHGISKQTLIHYDRIGLLKPRYRDLTSGYRYYDLLQIRDLDVILLLKDLGLSLEETKEFIKYESCKKRIDRLKLQHNSIEQKRKLLHKIQNYLGVMVTNFEIGIQIKPFEKGIKWIDNRSVLMEDVKSPYGHYEMEMLIKNISLSILTRFEINIHEFLFFVEEDEKGQELYKKIAVIIPEKGRDIIEAGNYAYIYHKGTIESRMDSKRELSKYIEKSKYRKIGPSIDRFSLHSLVAAQKDDYLIEIQYPVEPID